MSPLVRSLLALAALLATAATTQQDSYPCESKLIGRRTFDIRYLEPIFVPPQGAVIDIEDLCAKPGVGVELVGVLVDACNNDPLGAAATINGDLKQVEVWCVDDCPLGLTVDIVEYCKVVGPPRPPQSRRL